LGAVLVLTAIVYSSSFQNAFLNWDDPVNVTQNHSIRAFSAANVRVWFTEPLLGMYSPLVYASFTIDHAIGGLKPFVYHATNLALHLLAVLLVASIVRRLTEQPVASVIAAAFFAVHPANVAAVAPISVRSSLLYAVFYLAAYRAYLWYLDRPSARRWLLSLLLFAASGLSKSAAAVFPVLLVLTDVSRRRELDRRSLVEKIPFVAMALAMGAGTLLLRDDVVTGDPLRTTWIERAALAGFQLGRYLLTSVAPAGLSPFYPYPERVHGALPPAVFVVSAVLVVLAFVVARFRSVRAPLAFGLAFFVLHLVLVLKVVPVGEEFTADRYLYLPIVGLCIAGVDLFQRFPDRARRIGGALVIVAVFAFAWHAYARSADWRDDMAFNSRILEHYPRTATALANRAAAHLQAGDVEAAARDATEAIRIDSSNARAYFNRATASMLKGKPADALADMNRAISIDPRLPASFELRAQARLNIGDTAGARDDADRAIALAPGGDEVFKSFVTRGLARAMLGDGPGAIADMDRAIALNPAEPALLQNRGQVRINFGDQIGGCADLRAAVARGRTEAVAFLAACR